MNYLFQYKDSSYCLFHYLPSLLLVPKLISYCCNKCSHYQHYYNKPSFLSVDLTKKNIHHTNSIQGRSIPEEPVLGPFYNYRIHFYLIVTCYVKGRKNEEEDEISFEVRSRTMEPRDCLIQAESNVLSNNWLFRTLSAYF